MTEWDENEIVELSVPARPAFVSVLRTVTATLAARRDFTIDEIDDLRLAVDEAGALLLPHASPGTTLTATFSGETNTLRASLAVEVGDEPIEWDDNGFGWTVLTALTDRFTTELTDRRLSVTLSKSRRDRG